MTAYEVNESDRPRLAVESDLARIHELITRAYDKYLSRMDRPPAPLVQDYREQIRHGSIWVVSEPIIGLMSLIPTKDCLLIENIAVHPSAQGRGIGRRLMLFAEQEAGRLQLHRIKLYTNEVMVENIAFYRRLGYSDVGRKTEDGYRRVFMEKTILV